MAARLRKTHQEDVRTKIQVSQLINVLQDHALGKTADISASRMKAIEILLRKTLPDLSQTDGKVEVSGQIEQIVRKIVDPKA